MIYSFVFVAKKTVIDSHCILFPYVFDHWEIIDISKRTAELYKVVNEKHLEAGMVKWWVIFKTFHVHFEWEFRYLNRSVVFANVALACVLFGTTSREEGYISQCCCCIWAEGYISQLRPLFNRRDLKPNGISFKDGYFYQLCKCIHYIFLFFLIIILIIVKMSKQIIPRVLRIV